MNNYEVAFILLIVSLIIGLISLILGSISVKINSKKLALFAAILGNICWMLCCTSIIITGCINEGILK